MTDKVEADAGRYLDQIMQLSPDGSITGGLLTGIETGWFVQEIADAAFDYQKARKRHEEDRRCQRAHLLG
jgi:methylmalonyl-CoA mutase N-terminal domain/subunit